MKKLLLPFFLMPLFLQAQFWGTLNQFFDGNDTIPWMTLDVVIDQPNTSAWQIGQPTKTLFNSASTLPNAMVTDTSNAYPILDSSSFGFGVVDSFFSFGGIIALNWKQQLDFEPNADGGVVEYSTDSGSTWTNAFTSNYVYNFFGYLNNNKDTINSTVIGFTGTDTNWRDVWLCFDAFWLSQQDSLRFRYRIMTDSNQSNHEGWMIDNMSLRPTIVHTINEKERSEYIKLNPNPASDYTSIVLKKRKDLHFIKEVRLYDMKGAELGVWLNVPNRFKVPLDQLKAGNYLLSIETNIKREIHQLVVTE